jgi:hypothetical protein
MSQTLFTLVSLSKGREQVNRIDIFVFDTADGGMWCEVDDQRYEAKNIFLLDTALDKAGVQIPRNLHYKGENK